MYRVQWGTRAKKDYATGSQLKWYVDKITEILDVLRRDPFEPTPEHCFERLRKNLKGRCSRQINYHNRIVYMVLPNTNGEKDEKGDLYEGIVRILEAWGHKYRKPSKNKTT